MRTGGLFTRRIIYLTLLLSAFSAVVSAEPEESQPVKIGMIFPLTGPMSSFGEDIAKALPLLEKRFNSEQSKYKFILLLEDGKFGQTNAAITAAKKLVEVEGVRFLVVGSSGEILQIAPYAESAHVLSVTGFSSHPGVKNAGDYIFRTYIDADRGIELVAADLSKRNINRIAVISEESSFTSAIDKSLRNRIGDKLVLAENYIPGDADFKTVIAKARSKNPSAYYLNTAAPASFITLVRQLRGSGVKEIIYTYYVPSLKEVQDSLGPLLDGVVYLDFPDTPDSSDDFRNFLVEFEKANGSGIKAPFNFRTNYNAVRVIVDAVIAVGPDSGKAKDFLYSYDRPGAAGRLRFDSNGDALDLNLVLKTYGSKPRPN